MIPSDLRAHLGLLRARGVLSNLPAYVVVANLVSLMGVFFFGWKTFDLAFLYWLESLVIGVFTVMKLFVIQKNGGRPWLPFGFFLIHYGMFSLGMLIAIVGSFGPYGYTQSIGGEPTRVALRHIMGQGFFEFTFALLSLGMTHGYSYRHFFLGQKEYLDGRVIQRVGVECYLRLFVTMALVVFAAFALPENRLPEWVCAAFLIAAKTVTDLRSERREHPSKPSFRKTLR